MIRGMYAGISGMKSQQNKLDVIGNNLANVSTTGFKSSRIVFKDMLYQNSSNAVGGSVNLGGSNAKQVGLGATVGSIDRTMSQGMMQPTGRPLDVAIDGNSFFMVSKGPVAHGKNDIKLNNKTGELEDAGGREIFFTRDGSLNLDSEGYLVTTTGERVLGYSVNGSITKNGTIKFVDMDNPQPTATGLKTDSGLRTLKIPEEVKDADTGKMKKILSYSIAKDGLITGVVEGGKVTVIGQLATATFQNPEGLEAVGNNMYLNSSNSGAAVVSTGVGTDPDKVRSGGEILQGMLEMSNVDIAEQFTDLIVTSRAFQASSKIISTSDEILQDVVNLKR